MSDDVMRVPVCVRDGEIPASITIAGIQFDMGPGELETILGAAWRDMRDESPPVARVLERALKLGMRACEAVTVLAPRCSSADTEANRKRWAETGIGGIQELDELEELLAGIDNSIRPRFNWLLREFQDGGCRLGRLARKQK